MNRKEIISALQEAEKIQRERNELLKEVSSELGIDISFSEEALAREINELANKRIMEYIGKEVEASMKSLLS
jgi:seryl-tRNA synthetase|tara:strand:+ start:167 stop:382 length:216 start_codon:yes stop_codon:yes gene_type:complete